MSEQIRHVLTLQCPEGMGIVNAVTGLVLEAVAPVSEKLKEAQGITAELRDKVARAEEKRAELERKFAAKIDQSQPWEKRGVTEW